MLLLNAQNLSVEAGGKMLLHADDIKVYEGDKIGVVGSNGSGKTTLLKSLYGLIRPDTGTVSINGRAAYLAQIPDLEKDTLSGGERTKMLFNELLSDGPMLLFLDEPDNHLDINAIHYIEKQLASFDGAFLLVSHNRNLLNAVCNKIWEIEAGELHVFNGDYDNYQYQKELAVENSFFEYEQHTKEKKRLERAMASASKRSGDVRKTPKRMGNSEARLHKMGGQQQKKKLDNAAKSIKSRIDHLGSIDKPRVEKTAKITLPPSLKVHSPVAISAQSLSFSYDDGQQIFEDARFSLATGSKTALTGANGSGKSTLLSLIAKRDSQFSFAANVKIGYLTQFYSDLDLNATILENVMRVSIHDEAYSRLVLGRLRFIRDDVHKMCKVLSGGEKNKVNLAMLMLQNVNVLLLDEPTNHMDLDSRIAVEQALVSYEGTVLFVSHDEKFIENVATAEQNIRHKKLRAVRRFGYI